MHVGFLTTLKRLWTWSLGLMLFTSSSAAKAAERYYLIVFGAQKTINIPKESHTFGLFVKETDQGSLETVCISWLAEDLNATILRRQPLVGVNLDLDFTMQHYESRGCRISMWGPFEMDRELYQKAKVRRDILESGSVGYNPIDRRRRPLVADCIHGLSGVDVEPGLLRTRSAHGDIASYFVLEHLSRWLIHPETTYPRLISRLGLDQYCIRSRDFCERPHSPLPILPPYYDPSLPAEGPRGVEAPTPAAGQSPPAAPPGPE